MRPMIPSLLGLLLLPAAAGAQALVPCQRVDGSNAPGVMPATAYEVLVEGGTVRRAVLTLQNGNRSTTDFAPSSPGVSVRLASFPVRDAPGQVHLAFNRAFVQQDGTLFFETWFRGPQDAAPAYNWYRLRCQAAGGPTK
ncbi:hypothetical protein [Neoroseomonas rubea]|uniref:hypothetical protein n=1 Tax=Neoroseomonas rubea TaxID=2748666 RepID=UPI0018DF5ED5|nr:hypothetical protein [Roseomonas rubea]